jgi:hypothetical protein
MRFPVERGSRTQCELLILREGVEMRRGRGLGSAVLVFFSRPLGQSSSRSEAGTTFRDDVHRCFENSRLFEVPLSPKNAPAIDLDGFSMFKQETGRRSGRKATKGGTKSEGRSGRRKGGRRRRSSGFVILSPRILLSSVFFFSSLHQASLFQLKRSVESVFVVAVSHVWLPFQSQSTRTSHSLDAPVDERHSENARLRKEGKRRKCLSHLSCFNCPSAPVHATRDPDSGQTAHTSRRAIKKHAYRYFFEPF